MTYALRIFIYENGQLASWDNYSGQEMASLVDTIHGFWETPYLSYLCFVVRYDHDDEPCLHLVNGDDMNAAFPEEWLTKIITFGFGNPYRLVGDKIPIRPEQYGLSPWPADVKVLFEIS